LQADEDDDRYEQGDDEFSQYFQKRVPDI